jgi:hypothetical protein
LMPVVLSTLALVTGVPVAWASAPTTKERDRFHCASGS